MGVQYVYACDKCARNSAADDPVLTVNWSHPQLGGGVLVYANCCVHDVVSVLEGMSQDVKDAASHLSVPGDMATPMATPGG